MNILVVEASNDISARLTDIKHTVCRATTLQQAKVALGDPSLFVATYAPCKVADDKKGPVTSWDVIICELIVQNEGAGQGKYGLEILLRAGKDDVVRGRILVMPNDIGRHDETWPNTLGEFSGFRVVFRPDGIALAVEDLISSFPVTRGESGGESE